MRIGILFIIAVSLSACVNPSARISTELTRFGIEQAKADCVGNRLEANLSLGQLQQLARAAGALKVGDTTPGRLTPSDLIRVSSRIEDPKVPIEVARAAAGCGIPIGSLL